MWETSETDTVPQYLPQAAQLSLGIHEPLTVHTIVCLDLTYPGVMHVVSCHELVYSMETVLQKESNSSGIYRLPKLFSLILHQNKNLQLVSS